MKTFSYKLRTTTFYWLSLKDIAKMIQNIVSCFFDKDSWISHRFGLIALQLESENVFIVLESSWIFTINLYISTTKLLVRQ